MSIQYDILTEVQEAVEALCPTFDVQIRTSPTDKSGTFREGITIWPISVSEEYPGTNETDDQTYHIGVTIVANDDDNIIEDDIVGAAKQAVRQHFIHSRITAVSGCCTVLVETGRVYDSVTRDLDVSELVLKVIVRETRTWT